MLYAFLRHRIKNVQTFIELRLASKTFPKAPMLFSQKLQKTFTQEYCMLFSFATAKLMQYYMQKYKE